MDASRRATARCRCGGVELQAIGPQIVTSVCYCADCRNGSRRIEELPDAGPVREADGGTAYVLYRKDRIECSKGNSLLKSYKLKAESITNRNVATCCNSAMFVNFDKGPFWVSAYRARFQGDLPPLQMRICTKSRPAGALIPADAPSYPGYPPSLVLKLLTAGAAMWLRL